MIRLTLSDGTRIQLLASDIASVDPGVAGTEIVKTTGEILTVLQDVRTVEARVGAAITIAQREAAAPTPALVIDDHPDASPTVQSPIAPGARVLETPNHRRKRLLLGRVSRSAFMIGSTPFRPIAPDHRR